MTGFTDYNLGTLPCPAVLSFSPAAPVATPSQQVLMSEVAVFTDYKLDESYTPTKISIRVGNTFSDLREASGGSIV